MKSRLSDCSSSSGSEDEDDESFAMASQNRVTSKYSASPGIQYAMQMAERHMREACPESETGQKRCVMNARRNRQRHKFYVRALEQCLETVKDRTRKLELEKCKLKTREGELSEEVRHLRRQVLHKIYCSVTACRSAQSPSARPAVETLLPHVAMARGEESSGVSCMDRCSRCGDKIIQIVPPRLLHDHAYCTALGTQVHAVEHPAHAHI